jgi:3-hydroxyisobutyrate dehydrogenase
VSGGVAGAIEGRLAIMCSGDAAAFELVEPMLKVIGNRVFKVGREPGLGQVAKLANNLLSATLVAATSEALAFGVRSGLDPKQLIDIINASSGRSYASEVVIPAAVLTETFDIGFRMELMHKDVKLCLAEAENVNVPMWLGGATGQFYNFAMSQGYAKADVTAGAKIFASWAGIQYRSA